MPSIKTDIVLCDIEGTTTSISFVRDVLFAYAVNKGKEYLRQNWNETTVQQIVKDLVAVPEYKDFQAKYKELDTQGNPTVEVITNFVIYLVERDLKLGPLKTLQGLVWTQAYANDSIKGHIYDDVPKAFKDWTEKGIKICIYSSGSVRAQKLLFGNSERGDLTTFLSDYFDTSVGHKREAQSYKNIVDKLAVPSERILFLTDIIAEGQAAKEAGLQVIILDRPGNDPLSDGDRLLFPIVKSFDEIEVEKC